MIVKPILGGWRHKITGVQYLNATSQTEPLLKKRPWKNTKCNRAVQCVQTNDRTIQSLRHCATQMWREDYYIPNETDKYKTVKSKSYADIWLLDRHARVIQRNYRAYRWRKCIKECAQTYRDMLEKCKRYEEEKATANKLRHKQYILRQIYPRSRADFDMLYSLVEEWRIDRWKDIKSRLFKAGQCAENYRILEKTVEMFNYIDKHKQAIKRSYRKQRVLRFLTANCKSIKWSGYNGKLVEMITIKIQKARKFKKIYDALNNRDVSSEERMKLLITLKEWIEVHNCVEALDLLSLLDQEIALLNRKIKDLSLDYLNERITHTYLNFVRMYGICGCECVTEDSKDNELREPLETETQFCRNCLKLLPIRRFLPRTKRKKLSICNSCSSLSRRSIAHVDYKPYMFILNCIRAEEERQGSIFALAFIMQEQDIYYLINHIWQGQSVVSKTKDLFTLRMIRYQKDVEWAPWNCILLTKDEADIHYVNDLSMYSKHLINQVNLRHQIAKDYFKRFITFEKDFQKFCRFSRIQNDIKYKPPVTVENYDPSKKIQTMMRRNHAAFREYFKLLNK